MVLEALFFTAVALVFHAYFGYAMTLCVMGILRNKVTDKAPFFPLTTVIITAYNEERRIRQKLLNTLDLKYPKDKLQIIVASDGSTDSTNRVAMEYKHRGVELLTIAPRRGKENAQKKAVAHARGDVLVFTDVATILEPEGLEQIVFNFADPSVGCVSSEDRLVGKDGKPCGEGFYARYEMWLRRLETRANSLVGLSGSFFAARREVCQDFSESMQSDFRTVLSSMRMGLRAVGDPQSIGYYLDISDEKREFDRKVRTVLRGITVFFRHLEFLDFRRFGFFSYQYFCHKLLRWSVPFLLLMAFASNLLLLSASHIFTAFFVMQILFYGAAALGWIAGIGSGALAFPLKIPMYFLTVNASILVAWWRYIKGQRVVMWAPSQR